MGHKTDPDIRFEKLLRSLGFAVLRLQGANEKADEAGVRITDLRFKLDADNRTSVLVVVKAVCGEDALVGFTGGPDLETAVLAVGGKLAGGGMRWREDRPWQPKAGRQVTGAGGQSTPSGAVARNAWAPRGANRRASVG